MAKKVFAEAEANVENSKSKINHMWSEIDLARQRAYEIQSSGAAIAVELEGFDHFVSGLKVKIESERNVLRELLAIAEEKRELLVEASKEHKALLKLKEKMYFRYKKAKEKKEQKQMDDMATMRFKRASR